MSMVRALASEFQKVFTTRMWWLLAILLVAYVAFLAGGLGAFLGWASENPDAAADAGNTTIPPGEFLAPLIYSFASSVGYVFPVLLGALAVTGEFRHKTLTPTFLAEPNRSLVLGAKFGSHLVLGAGLGVIAFLTSVGTGAAALAIFGPARGWTRATRGRSSRAASWPWPCGRASASASARSCRTRSPRS